MYLVKYLSVDNRSFENLQRTFWIIKEHFVFEGTRFAWFVFV
jgi:hypothetical protein